MDYFKSKMNMPPNHDLLGGDPRNLALIAADLSHRVFSLSLIVFGHNLLSRGLTSSLASAGAAARSYVVSGSIYCTLETLLANLRGKEDFINSGVAGCSLGLLKTSFLGSKIPHLLNCALWGTAGMMDFYIISRPLPDKPREKHLVLPKSTIVSCFKIVFENVFMSSTLGIIMGSAVDPWRKKGLIDSFRDASSLTKFSAVSGGVLAYSFLLLRELQGNKDDVVKAELLGLATGLFIPQAYDTPNALPLRCLGAGAAWLAVHRMIAQGPFFPHIYPMYTKLSDAGSILPPFTLPLPKSIEDGFSAYYESLKKCIKKA